MELPIRTRMPQFVLCVPVYSCVLRIELNESVITEGLIVFGLTDGVSIILKELVGKLFWKHNRFDQSTFAELSLSFHALIIRLSESALLFNIRFYYKAKLNPQILVLVIAQLNTQNSQNFVITKHLSSKIYSKAKQKSIQFLYNILINTKRLANLRDLQIKINERKMKPQNQKEKYQQILKKIQKETSETKRERTINILRGQQSKNHSYAPGPSIFTPLTNYLLKKRNEVWRYFRVKQNMHIMILSGFLIFSTYLCWTIQKKFDVLKKRAKKTQTIKERQIQKQNQYINRMLRKKEFESVPIPDQLTQTNHYKFQEKAERGGLSFNTKQDLLDAISKQDYEGGPQKLYEDALKKQQQKKLV